MAGPLKKITFFEASPTNGVPGDEVEVLGRIVQHERVHAVDVHLQIVYTVCRRSLDPFYIVN